MPLTYFLLLFKSESYETCHTTTVNSWFKAD